MARKQINPVNSSKPFPTVLRKLMDEQNTSQDKLAKYLGKTRQAISLYCVGESAPDLETLVKIAKYFDTSTDYLLGLSNDPARYPTAVDDLHLSPDAVSNLIVFSSNEDICYALNLILESPTFRRILNKLKSIPKSISAEIAYVKRLENAYIEDIEEPEKRVYLSELGMLGQFMANDIVASDLTNEIISLHPEVKDRIEVLYGSDAIEKRIDDLGNDFAFLLKMQTGYFDLENIRADYEYSQSKRLLTK